MSGPRPTLKTVLPSPKQSHAKLQRPEHSIFADADKNPGLLSRGGMFIIVRFDSTFTLRQQEVVELQSQTLQ